MRKLLVTVVIAVFALSGCAGASGERTVTVLAAASLTESFDEIGRRFSAEHPDVRVRFDYQGSSTLSEQITQGRQADVFASANPSTMDKVVRSVGVRRGPTTFATNRLTIAVPEGNPLGISSLADLRGRTLVVCAPQVPCGSAAKSAAKETGVQLRPASEENDVKSVLRKVLAGEADAGLVYESDVRSASGRVDAVDLPETRTSYPIAVLRDAPEARLAERFEAYVRGPVGRKILTDHGFGLP